MELQKIADFDNNGLTMEDTIRALQKRRIEIAYTLHLDKRLVHSNQWEKEKEMYPCWCGPFMIYERPGVPFGAKVEWEGYTVLIPKKFQGMKDVALVSGILPLRMNGKTITSSKFQAVKIPINDGWYDINPKTGLPIGEKKDYADNRRKWYRWQNQPRIGLLVRGYDDLVGGGRRGVVAFDWPDYRFGVFGVVGKGSRPAKCKHEWTCSICGAEKR